MPHESMMERAHESGKLAGETPQSRFYRIAAALLRYPGDPDFSTELPALRAEAAREGWDGICRCIDGWLDVDALFLVQRYVESFDFRPDCALYLTAFEHGDHRDRGRALWLLHMALRSSGWELDGRELPDFLPVLLEWMAVDPNAAAKMQVPQRVARMVQGILSALPQDHLYRPVFEALAAHLPPVADAERPDGASASVDETVPYPLFVVDDDAERSSRGGWR